MNEAEAATVALQGLSYLLEQPRHLSRFMALTGLSGDDLRQAADTTELHLAVLDHFLADESLLLAFCQEFGIAPSSISPARDLLARGA